MTINQNPSSRFIDTEVIANNTSITLGLWNAPNVVNDKLLNQEDVQKLQINQDLAGRPDKIAYQYYGSASLEWIIVMFNRPLNTLGWPKVGSTITIPTKSAVNREL